MAKGKLHVPGTIDADGDRIAAQRQLRLLLDTHVALWAVTDHPRLSGKARRLIHDPDNHVVGAVTVWKNAIKHAVARAGPLDMPTSGTTVLGYFQEAGYKLLAIFQPGTLARLTKCW